MFELVVTLSKAAESLRKGHKAPTRDVRTHYGRGVEALRLQMAMSTVHVDDATIMSVMALLGIAVRNHNTHLATSANH